MGIFVLTMCVGSFAWCKGVANGNRPENLPLISSLEGGWGFFFLRMFYRGYNNCHILHIYIFDIPENANRIKFPHWSVCWRLIWSQRSPRCLFSGHEILKVARHAPSQRDLKSSLLPLITHSWVHACIFIKDVAGVMLLLGTCCKAGRKSLFLNSLCWCVSPGGQAVHAAASQSKSFQTAWHWTGNMRLLLQCSEACLMSSLTWCVCVELPQYTRLPFWSCLWPVPGVVSINPAPVWDFFGYLRNWLVSNLPGGGSVCVRMCPGDLSRVYFQCFNAFERKVGKEVHPADVHAPLSNRSTNKKDKNVYQLHKSTESAFFNMHEGV